MTIQEAQRQAEEFAPEAAKWEAEYNDLKRRESGVLARCISDHKWKIVSEIGDEPIQVEITYQWAKNDALQDERYTSHLKEIAEAQERYLAADKSFRTVIEYLKAVQSENYKANSKIKAGIF